MRAVGVVVLQVLTQHDVEVACSCDQDVVEAFSAQGADEALRDRVCLSTATATATLAWHERADQRL
jgi:hypothetical protein